MANVAPGDFVQVTVNSMPPNTKKNYIDLGWNNRYYRAEVGKTVAVPFEAMANHFGDPRSGNTAQALRYGGPDSEPSYVATRESEVARLRLRYGILSGAEGGFTDSDDNVLVPDVTVTTLDGEEISTVIADPEGNNNTSPLLGSGQTQQDLMARMQAQIDFLQSQVAGMGGTESSPTTIPVDDSSNPVNPDSDTHPTGFIDEPPNDES